MLQPDKGSQHLGMDRAIDQVVEHLGMIVVHHLKLYRPIRCLSFAWKSPGGERAKGARFETGQT